MITQETVFILGAGASKPYGFPLGQDLVEMILHRLDPEPTDNRLIAQAVNRAANNSTMLRLKGFLSDLSDSGADSVDAFLEHNPEFVPTGKAAIAAMLHLSESEKGLRGCKANENWYQYFLKMLNAPYDSFQENKASVITYNYDRSLEEYLFKALRVRDKENHGDADWAIKLKESIPIVHLHGQLGAYQHFVNVQTQSYVPFGDWQRGGFLKTAADGIRIIHEDFDLDNDPVFQQAYTLISEAKYVFFIGFGYHPTNIRRLRLKKCTSGGANMYGTAYGLTDAERVKVTVGLGQRTSHGNNLGAGDHDTLRFLRESNLIQTIYN
jgi:hypothetical protein